MVDVGTFLARLALKLRLPVKGIIKRSLFQQFCGGESIPDCQKSIDHLESFNIKTILDYSVEGLESEESFDHTMEEALRIADYARNASGIPFCVVKLTGLGSSTIMEKVQSNQKLSKEEKFTHKAPKRGNTGINGDTYLFLPRRNSGDQLFGLCVIEEDRPSLCTEYVPSQPDRTFQDDIQASLNAELFGEQISPF